MEANDLLQSIDRGLDPLGSNTKQLIYWRMLESHRVPSGEAIISDPQALEHTIEEVSGPRAVRIGKLIAREIRKTFDLSIEETDDVVTAIEAAKEHLIY